MFSRLDLAEALQARLSSPLWRTYVSQDAPRGVQLPAGAFVVGDISPGLEFSDRACEVVSDVTAGLSLRCVGQSRRQALNTFDVASGLLRGWRWRPDATALRLASSTDVFLDDSIDTDPRYVVTSVWRFDL